jgi:MFS family permease
VNPARLAALDALREPPFRRLWLAGLCVSNARWMSFLALGWIALELTDSPFLVGVAAFSRAAPMMAFGVLAGLVADRVDRGRLMVGVQCLNLAGALALFGLFAAGRGSYTPLVLVETLLGAAWAIDFPVRRTVLYTLVGPGRVTNAVSLESVSGQGSKMLGPLVAGLLLARVGPIGCYAVLVGLYLVALGLVASLARHVALPPPGRGEPLLAGVAAGVREARAHAGIRGVLAITVIMNSLVFPYQHILAVFARDVLAIGPERLGLLVATDGLGALVGSLVLAGWRGLTAHGLVFAGASLGSATLVLGFALSPWYALSLALAFFIGLADSGFGSMQSTIVLLAAPEHARGRIMGILLACIGTGPVGALWIGFFAGLVGAPAAAASGAGAAALLMLTLPVASRMLTRDPLAAAGGRA